MTSLEDFRTETRDWLEENCPASMRTRMVAGEDVGGGRKRKSTNPDAYVWLERMAEKGWTAPTWPKEYRRWRASERRISDSVGGIAAH